MSDTQEVISAFLDDEPFDPSQLAEALSEPDGRVLLLDLLALRHLVQPQGHQAPVSFERQPRRASLKALVAVAAVFVALAGGYFGGQRGGVAPSETPPCDTSRRCPSSLAGSRSREDAMRIIPWCLLIAHFAASLAHAQTPNDLQVRLGAYTSNIDGGEKPVGVWFSTGPVAIGKRVTSTFSVGESCDAFSVSSDGSLRENATAAWRIDVTPTRVVGDAVTFRLRWQMAGMFGDRMSLEFSDAFPRPTEIELTLRPGESWPVSK